jgi:rhodanese-related sulfurtransferase
MKTTDRPTLQEFHIDGVKHINPLDALEALQNGEAVMIDVRELSEVQLESVPLDRVLNHPMSVILDRLSYITKDQNIIVACPGGVRSSKVASLLMNYGYKHVASLDGGLKTWKAKGLPFESNSPEGCGCNPGKHITTAAPFKNRMSNIDYKNLRRI